MSKKNGYRKPRYKLMSRDTIQAATKGEPDAVAAVLHDFDYHITGVLIYQDNLEKYQEARKRNR